VANLEAVPVSGRRRFNVISPAYERQMGEQMYHEVLNQYRGRILAQNHPDVVLVKRVLARLLEGLAKLEAGSETDQSPHDAAVSAGGAGGGWREGLDGWEVNVVHGEEANAFVLPGNKVFVFTGILPLMKDDSGVASVLSHEIAHNIAHHSAERISSTVVLYYPLYAIVSIALFMSGADLGITNFLLRTVLDVGLEKPGSRRQESEADFIGLSMVSMGLEKPNS
jgi:predicted Zn-dependent protease